MKLIVGLGNPGPKYELTRHNIGFMVIDYLADEWGVSFNKCRGNGLAAQHQINGEKFILLKPQTYMNLSGICVKIIMEYFKIDIGDLVVVYDDLDLPLGTLRIRASGSSGGHKGLHSIIQQTMSQNILRVKIGIGRTDIDTVDHVLGAFTDDEWKIVEKIIPKAKEAVEFLLNSEVEAAMNMFNKDYAEEE